MKKILFAITFLPVIVFSQLNKNSTTSKQKKYSTAGKKIIVYTTAENTNNRLTVTDNLQFKNVGQPKETQICVFVDPSKTFQSFFGKCSTYTKKRLKCF